MKEKNLTKKQIFSARRNFNHGILKGITTNLDRLVESKAITAGEEKIILSTKEKLLRFSKDFFSKSARRLAEEVFLGK